jgi:hypothetical protein
MVTVRDSVHAIVSSFNPDSSTATVNLDGLLNRCVSAVTEALKSSSTTLFTDTQREHLSLIFKSMRDTHETIQDLLRFGNKSPRSVDSIPIARMQLETLYAICLVIEDGSNLDSYLKDSWKQIYIRDLLMAEECQNLPTIMSVLNGQSESLEKLRLLAGVSDEEKLTIRCEQLDEPLPAGVTRKIIPPFPTPGRVLKRIKNEDRKQMLKRLYFEYQFLCSFVHFSTRPRTFKGIFDSREPFRQMFTATELDEMFQKEIARPALWIDFLSVAQGAAEMVCAYPGDVELRRTAVEAWGVLADRTVMGRAVWEIHTKKLLGVIL